MLSGWFEQETGLDQKSEVGVVVQFQMIFISMSATRRMMSNNQIIPANRTPEGGGNFTWPL
jgi:hypothetical protein